MDTNSQDKLLCIQLRLRPGTGLWTDVWADCFFIRACSRKFVVTGVDFAAFWTARTCPRFESGDLSPHSKVSQLTTPRAQRK